MAHRRVKKARNSRAHNLASRTKKTRSFIFNMWSFGERGIQQKIKSPAISGSRERLSCAETVIAHCAPQPSPDSPCLLASAPNLDKGRCIAALSRDTICVLRNEAFLVGDTVEISDAKINETYRALHFFLRSELFTYENLPDSLTDFLELLVALQPTARDNESLIVRHYGILPDMARIAFVNNLVRLPRTWRHESRVAFFNAVDSANEYVEDDWPSEFYHEDRRLVDPARLEQDKILWDIYKSKRRSHPISSATKAYTLMNFCRHCHNHAGDDDRMPIDRSGPAYREWLRGFPEDEKKDLRKKIMTYVMSSTQVKELKDREEQLKQHDVTKILLDRYPLFYTGLQRALHNAGLLHRFCIHPYEDVLET